MDKIKIMIVDDQIIVREGLKKLLEISDDIKVVAEASNGFECLEVIEKIRPKVILMDIKMPEISNYRTLSHNHPILNLQYRPLKILC